LASHSYRVDLFEADKLLGKTSSASSKLLHGGIRYLEHGHLGLVRDSLLDRAWWLENAPHALLKFVCQFIETALEDY
jgi:glycerol-3-phosphate dehydrogenase